MSTVLYIGLRRPELEWAAELDAARQLGLRPHVASDVDVSHTGLPADQMSRFAKTDTAEEVVAAAGGAPAAVLCWGDKHVGLTSAIAERFGLRGVGAEAAAAATDKIAQRRALDAHGLNPAWRSGETLNELRTAVAELGLPLVFKLAHCSGGRGTTVITEDTDLEAVFAQTKLNYVPSTAFLVEEYLDGSEHSVSGVVSDGVATVLGVTDKLLHDNTFVTWGTITPSAGPEDALRQAAATAAEAIGYRDGGFHADLRLTADGPKVLEVGGRLGGDTINSHLIPLASEGKVVPYQAILSVLTAGEAPEPAAFTRAAAMFVIPTGDRPVADVVEHALKHPLAVAAVDWAPEKAVAVVVTAANTEEIHALDGLRDWFE